MTIRLGGAPFARCTAQLLTAIRGGDVDAVVLGGPPGEQLYTLVSADRPYRVIVEQMGEAAVTVSARGIVLYVNRRLTQMVGRTPGALLGRDVSELVPDGSAAILAQLLTAGPGSTRRAELELVSADGGTVPALASVTGIQMDDVMVRCLIAADLTGRRRDERTLATAYAQLRRSAEELEEEHRLKEALQRAVLPRALPTRAGIELAARYLAADRPALVGGDWYDAYCLSDGSLALAVGDVVGHDLDAAATMGQLRNALRAYAATGEPPARVLTRLNQLTTQAEGGLATVVYGRLAPDLRAFRWASAGHPPPLLLTGSGPEFLAPAAGAMLGAHPTTAYGTVHTPVRPQQTLLLYTDGLIERRDRDLDTGSALLADAARDLAELPPDAVCDTILSRLLPDQAHEDDVCLLALRLASPLQAATARGRPPQANEHDDP